MWIDDLADHLIAQSIPELADDAVFVHTIPAGKVPALMLASGYNGIPVDPELPGYHKGALQIIARASRSVKAEEIAQKVSDALEITSSTDVGNLTVHYLRPRSLPAVFPRSNGDYYEASVNFDICFLRLSA